MSESDAVKAADAPPAVGPYSHARWAGELLFLSGQVGLDPASGELRPGAAADQAEQAMQNLAAVLKAAGLGWSSVVKCTIFLTDMADFAAVNQVYAGFFAGLGDYPARACVQVAALPLGALVEIEAIARRS